MGERETAFSAAAAARLCRDCDDAELIRKRLGRSWPGPLRGGCPTVQVADPTGRLSKPAHAGADPLEPPAEKIRQARPWMIQRPGPLLPRLGEGPMVRA